MDKLGIKIEPKITEISGPNTTKSTVASTAIAETNDEFSAANDAATSSVAIWQQILQGEVIALNQPYKRPAGSLSDLAILVATLLLKDAAERRHESQMTKRVTTDLASKSYKLAGSAVSLSGVVVTLRDLVGSLVTMATQGQRAKVAKEMVAGKPVATAPGGSEPLSADEIKAIYHRSLEYDQIENSANGTNKHVTEVIKALAETLVQIFGEEASNWLEVISGERADVDQANQAMTWILEYLRSTIESYSKTAGVKVQV